MSLVSGYPVTATFAIVLMAASQKNQKVPFLNEPRKMEFLLKPFGSIGEPRGTLFFHGVNPAISKAEIVGETCATCPREPPEATHHWQR